MSDIEARPIGRIVEDRVPPVSEQLVLPAPHDVEVPVAVTVDIGDRGLYPGRVRGDAGALRDVLEPAVLEVPVEVEPVVVRPGLLLADFGRERPSQDDEIQPAVPVQVGEGTAPTGGVDDVPEFRDGKAMYGRYSGGKRDVGEDPGRGRRRKGFVGHARLVSDVV